MAATTRPPDVQSQKTEDIANRSPPHPPDGGYGWVIVLGTFVSTAISAGTMFSFSVFYVAFLNAFNKSKSETAWIGSISLFMFAMTGPVSVALARKIGHRKTVMIAGIVAATGHLFSSFATSIYHLYITYGFITGFGLGLAHVASMEMVGNYFKGRLSIAMGIALTGGGLGQVGLSIVSQYIINYYGWRGTLMIFSAFSLHMSVAGALFRPLGHSRSKLQRDSNSNTTKLEKNTEYSLIEDKGDGRDKIIQAEMERDKSEQCGNSDAGYKRVDDKDGGEVESRNCRLFKSCSYVKSFVTSLYDVSLFREPVYITILTCTFVTTFGLNTLLTHLARKGVDNGLNLKQASFTVAMVGIGQIFGRPVLGIVGNLPRMKPSVIWGVCLFVCAVLGICSIYITTFTAQLFMMCVFGASMGGYMVISSVAMAYFLGHKKMGPALSVNFQVVGCCGLIAGPISGFLRDYYGDYIVTYWVGSCAILLGSGLAFLFIPIDKCVKRRRNKTSKEKYAVNNVVNGDINQDSSLTSKV